jgi:hypothetical protein
LVIGERLVTVVVLGGDLAVIAPGHQQPPPRAGRHPRRDFALLADQLGDRDRYRHQPTLVTGPEPQLGHFGGDGEREHARKSLPVRRAKLGQLLGDRVEQTRGFGDDRALIAEV